MRRYSPGYKDVPADPLQNSPDDNDQFPGQKTGNESTKPEGGNGLNWRAP